MSKLFITSAAVVALFAVPVLALEIENKDGKEYSVYLGNQSPNATETFNIPAGKKVGSMCSDICTISLEGTSEELAVVAGEKYEIKGGKLIRKN